MELLIGGLNIWKFALKMQLARLSYLAILNTLWKETHAYSLNGIHLDVYVIRKTAKYNMYTVV